MASSSTVNLREDLDPKKDEKEGSIREVGNEAVWSLSSCKAGMCKRIQLLLKGSLI